MFHPENDPGVKLPNDCKSKHSTIYLLHRCTILVPINMSKSVVGKSLISHFKPFLKFFQIIGVSPLKVETCEECDYEIVKPFNLCLHLMLLSNSFSSTVKENSSVIFAMKWVLNEFKVIENECDILNLRLFILLFVIICTILGVGFFISAEDSIITILEVIVKELKLFERSTCHFLKQSPSFPLILFLFSTNEFAWVTGNYPCHFPQFHT